MQVLDRYFLGITLLVTVAYQLTGFAIAWTFQFDKITDFTGGSNFFLLALLTLLLGGHYHVRNILASVFVMVWAVRIAGFLLYRVLKTGSDNRFDEIRANFFKFLGFWVGQILWVWIVSLPVTILNSPAVSEGTAVPSFGTGSDIVGVVLWAVGWLIETISDQQKFIYKNSGKAPKGRPVSSGLWAWSRHPPYFGEMLCWWGIWFLTISPTTHGTVSSSARAAQYAAVVSPIFTFLILMFASGVPTGEKPQAKRYYKMSHGEDADDGDAWRNYQAYLEKHRFSYLFHLKSTASCQRLSSERCCWTFPCTNSIRPRISEAVENGRCAVLDVYNNRDGLSLQWTMYNSFQ